MNTIALSLKWYDQDRITGDILQGFNYMFTVIFIAEAIIKVIALKGAYFRDNWNRFDFLIAIISFVGIILDQLDVVDIGGKATIIRTFRVVRLFKIVKRAKVLKLITDTLIVTLPHLMNVGGLLLLILYIYAILGMQLFAKIKLQDLGLTQRWNFQNFFNAFLMLIRISTGEEWELVMMASVR